MGRVVNDCKVPSQLSLFNSIPFLQRPVLFDAHAILSYADGMDKLLLVSAFGISPSLSQNGPGIDGIKI